MQACQSGQQREISCWQGYILGDYISLSLKRRKNERRKVTKEMKRELKIRKKVSEREGEDKLTHNVHYKEVLAAIIAIDVCPFLSKECFRGTQKLLHVPVLYVIKSLMS